MGDEIHISAAGENVVEDVKTNWKIALIVLGASIIDGLVSAYLHFDTSASDLGVLVVQIWFYLHMPVVNWAFDSFLYVSDMHEYISPFRWMLYYLACIGQTALLAFLGSWIYFRRQMRPQSKDLSTH